MKPDDLNITEKQKVLLRAAELIRQGFSKHYLARDKNGAYCDPADKKAVSYCLLGAIDRARHEFGLRGIFDYDRSNFGIKNWQATNEEDIRRRVMMGDGVNADRNSNVDADLASWNNLPETTAEDVAQKLEELAWT